VRFLIPAACASFSISCWLRATISGRYVRPYCWAIRTSEISAEADCGAVTPSAKAAVRIQTATRH
jgi:hypothetical protein